MEDSGCLRVSQILVNKVAEDSVLQVLGSKARKKCQIVPFLPMYRESKYVESRGLAFLLKSPRKIDKKNNIW